MAILLDITNSTANLNHSKNPQQINFMNVKSATDNNSGGLGSDLVFRDPWGDPYIITLDLDYNNKVRDSFYCQKTVSQQNGTAAGFNGLANLTDPSGNGDNFTASGSVMVWSLGPTGKADPAQKANSAINKDHIISW